MNKTTEALKLAEALENDAKEHREVSYGLDCPPERTANWKHALNCEAAARLIREVLAEQALQNLSDFHQYMEATEPKCSEHPDAPHGFDRNASHNADRYVCECEGWEPEQEPVEYHVENVYERGDKYFAWIGDDYVQIFTAPVSAKREWVDLTDDEMWDVFINKDWTGEPLQLVSAVIAAFKDKNK